MKIAHLANYGNQNAGDSALQHGLRRVLSEDWPEALEFTSMQVTTAKIRAINECDLCLIGGGGLLSHSDTPTGLLIPFTDLKQIAVPVIIYGVGHNLFSGDSELDPSRIDRLREGALAFSVRNDGSAERLGMNLDVVPDPGMWIEADDSSRQYDVVIQLAGNKFDGRVEDEQRFLGQIKKFILELRDNGLTVATVSHIVKDDWLTRLCSKWGAVPVVADKRRRPENVRRFFGIYKGARLVLAMRGHAQICAYGLDVPFISIITQGKNRGFAEDVGYGEFAFECGPKLGRQLSAAWPVLIAGGEPRHRLGEYREQARAYHDRLWSLLNA